MDTFKVAEAGELAGELHLDSIDRAVALLGDDNFGDVAHLFQSFFAALLPLEKFVVTFVLVLGRASALQIIFLAEDKHDHVGVLLDGARFTKVGQHGSFVLALLDGARKLRQRDHRNVQLLGQRLQSTGNFRDLLHTAIVARQAGAGYELQIVDDDQT